MNVRGRIVHLTDACGSRDCGARLIRSAVSRIVGEALALAALLGASLKFEGALTVQTRSDGPVRMIVADYSFAGRPCGPAPRLMRDAVAARWGPTPAFERSGRQGIDCDHDRSRRAIWSAIRGSFRWKAERIWPRRPRRLFRAVGADPDAYQAWRCDADAARRWQRCASALAGRRHHDPESRRRWADTMRPSLGPDERDDDWNAGVGVVCDRSSRMSLVDPQVEAERLL